MYELGMISKLFILFPLLRTVTTSPLTYEDTGRPSFPTVHTPSSATTLWNVSSSTATDTTSTGASATPAAPSHPTHVKRGISGDLSDGVKIQLRPGAQAYNGRGTFFAPGLGACGTHAGKGDSIVALNSAQYGE